jgi:hypothetical protein
LGLRRLTERVPVTEQMPVDWAKKLAQSKGSGSEEFFSAWLAIEKYIYFVQYSRSPMKAYLV